MIQLELRNNFDYVMRDLSSDCNLRTESIRGIICQRLINCMIVVPGRSFFNVDGSQGKGITIHAFEVGSQTTPLLSSIYKSADTRVIISIQSTGTFLSLL